MYYVFKIVSIRVLINYVLGFPFGCGLLALILTVHSSERLRASTRRAGSSSRGAAPEENCGFT